MKRVDQLTLISHTDEKPGLLDYLAEHVISRGGFFLLTEEQVAYLLVKFGITV